MKNKNLAAVLALFLGSFGVHKFYLGKIGLGILYLCFCWSYIPAILGVIESIRLFSMSEGEFNQKYYKASPAEQMYSEPEEVDYQEIETEELSLPEGEITYCPECGAKNSITNKFCESCGHKFELL